MLGVGTVSTALAQGARNALEFDGVRDYVDVPYNAALNPTSDFTVELWVRCDGNDGRRREPLSSINASFQGYTFIADASNNWDFGYYGSGVSGPSVQDGEWTHLAAVHHGTAHTFTFFVNGTSAGTEDASGYDVNPNPTVDLLLGTDNTIYGGPYWFNGAISEVRFWNVARTQAQIQSTMNITLTGHESGLVAYWQLNESGTNTTAYEEVGSYNGDLQNFTFSGDGWVSATDLSLPVQATGFKAVASNGSVTITWQTQSEINNLGFNITRKDHGTGISSLIASYISDVSLRGLGTSTTGKGYSYRDIHIVNGHTYDYTVESVASDGTKKDYPSIQVTVNTPKDYALYQNYPNPFNPSTTIRFDLKEGSAVTLEIYNVLGQRVEEWNYGTMNAGRYNEVMNFNSRSSGVYFYRLSAVGKDGEKYISVKRLLLMK